MDNRKPTQWRARRYATHPNIAIRFVDPIADRPVEVGNDLIAELWHQLRFNARIARIEVGGGALVVPGRTKPGSRQVDLVSIDSSGKRVLHMVSKLAVSAASERGLLALARANDATAEISLRSTLRGQAVLIANLRQLRQCMQGNRASMLDPHLADGLLAMLPATPAEMARRWGRSQSQIQACLGLLYCRGLVHIDLSGDRYGSETTVERP
jgi:hypothetical protein